MTQNALLQIIFFLIVLLIFAKPLGWYIARVYQRKNCGLEKILLPVENFIYRCCQINIHHKMDWKTYLSAVLMFNLLGVLIVYGLQRLQFYLPFNPQQFSAVPSDLAFNTAISFVTNTNWQAYSGETTLSYFTQMVGLTAQNFLSAATGVSILMALIRGIAKHEQNGLGNFWVDVVRCVLYILLPLAIILSIILVSQGAIQNMKPYELTHLLQPLQVQNNTVTQQIIPMGPVASQVAIKQLGTNGGGFFNVNAAHPFENPTPLTNFLEMLAMILIPAALCFTFGTLVRDKRQGYAILLAMLIIFIPTVLFALVSEQSGNPALWQMGVDSVSQHDCYSAGNMEGKETRFGIVNSALWAVITTATSNGSVNTMLDSFTPLGSLFPLSMMHLGEVIFGGVGSGLYGMVMLVLITVFVSGLMVGRTPEYLGKKIEPFEMKMASFAVLVMPIFVLIISAIATVIPEGTSRTIHVGAHGFTEILYAFTSMGNNNGSAFAGLNANSFFYNVFGGLHMLITRFWIAIPTLAIAGSLIRKKQIPNSAGTLETHRPLFVILLVSVILILGALSFIPVLALGPIVEHLQLWSTYGH